MAAYLQYQKICSTNLAPYSIRSNSSDPARNIQDLDEYSMQKFLEDMVGPITEPSYKRYWRQREVGEKKSLFIISHFSFTDTSNILSDYSQAISNWIPCRCTLGLSKWNLHPACITRYRITRTSGAALLKSSKASASSSYQVDRDRFFSRPEFNFLFYCRRFFRHLCHAHLHQAVYLRNQKSSRAARRHFYSLLPSSQQVETNGADFKRSVPYLCHNSKRNRIPQKWYIIST